MKKLLIIIAILSIPFCLLVGYFIMQKSISNKDSSNSLTFKNQDKNLSSDNQISKNENVVIENQSSKSSGDDQKVQPEIVQEIANIKLNVPFTVQAPLGNWSDPNFQNACEEASIIMAIGWLNGKKTISPEEARTQMLEIIEFEENTFGYSTDTNAKDVVTIFQKLFKKTGVESFNDINISDIKNQLSKGRIIIVPTFGQALKNPNYTSPGPVAHMLVIIGFDSQKNEFITNDPGTRKGAGYRYDENVLFNAIWEYASGKKDPPVPTMGNMKKVMIVVSKD